MIYKSPLHIIPEEYHADLSPSTLKKVKKKLLLRLQLESKITIEINGREYDKNQLLAAFDELMNQPDFHRKLYQNQWLLQFIEKGSLAIFYNHQKQEWLEKDDAYRDWVLKHFCERLSGVYQELIEEDTTQSMGIVKIIWDSNIHLPSKYENIVYTKVYDLLKNRIDFVRSQYSEIVEISKGVVRLRKGLGENINYRWVNIYDYLPDSLIPLRDDYCRWNNEIINQFFSRPEMRNLANVSKPDLITLERAARIASIAVNKEVNTELANKLKLVLSNAYSSEHALETRAKRSETSAGEAIASTIFFVLLILFFTLSISKPHKQSTYNSKPPGNFDMPLAKEIVREVERRMMQKMEKENTLNAAIFREYNLKSVKKKGTTKKLPTYNVVVEAETIPSSIQINKDLKRMGKLFFSKEIPEKDYYLNLKIIQKKQLKIQKTYQFTAGADGFKAVYFEHPEIKKINFKTNRVLKIAGSIDSEFLSPPQFIAEIDTKKDKLKLTIAEAEASPERNQTFKLSNLSSTLADAELSLTPKLALEAITLYRNCNGMKLTKDNTFVLHSKLGVVELYQLNDSRSKDIIKLTTFPHESKGITTEIILFYDYKKHFIPELHISYNTPDNLYFNPYDNDEKLPLYSIDLWAYR